jgi:hypothetical protein
MSSLELGVVGMPHSYGWHVCSGYHKWLSLYLEFARLDLILDLFLISTVFYLQRSWEKLARAGTRIVIPRVDQIGRVV